MEREVYKGRELGGQKYIFWHQSSYAKTVVRSYEDRFFMGRQLRKVRTPMKEVPHLADEDVSGKVPNLSSGSYYGWREGAVRTSQLWRGRLART